MRFEQLIHTAFLGSPVVFAAPTDASAQLGVIALTPRQDVKSPLPSPIAPWAEVKCDQGSLTSAYNDPYKQWTDAETLEAYCSCHDAYKANSKGIKWANFISDFFHARPNLNCQDLDNDNCQVTINCAQGSSPNAPVNSTAGHLIINSMISMHNIY